MVSSAINTCSGDYLLESANKLFGEKSARFKEVSEVDTIRVVPTQAVWKHSSTVLRSRLRIAGGLLKAGITVSTVPAEDVPCKDQQITTVM